MTDIPDWLVAEDEYSPPSDRSSFIDKSTRSIMRALSSLKRNNAESKAKDANTSLRLFGVLVLIILTSVAKNYSFVLLMIAVAVVRIASLNGEKIRSLFKVVLPALLLSFLILLPSVFIGNPKTPLTVLGKIFVCTSFVMSVNLTAPFNEITRSLKAFHIPNVVIFTFDLTIRYIALLGEVCSNMLTALKVRSIGKNKSKSAAASGILGTVFIKARSAADDTSKAMECRGFSGVYVVTRKKKKISVYDLAYIAIMLMLAGAFVYLEVIL